MTCARWGLRLVSGSTEVREVCEPAFLAREQAAMGACERGANRTADALSDGDPPGDQHAGRTGAHATPSSYRTLDRGQDPAARTLLHDLAAAALALACLASA